MDIKNFKTFVAIDIETTGLQPMDEIIDIGAIRFDYKGNVLAKYSRMFKPRKGFIPNEISVMTGITMDHVNDKMSYSDMGAPKKIWNFCNDYPLVGHNIIDFDLKFLRFDYVRTPAIFDTMSMAHERFKRRMSLDECCNKLEVVRDRSLHRGLGDAHLAMEIFLRMAFPVIQESITTVTVISTMKEEIPKPVAITEAASIKTRPTDIPSTLNGVLSIPFTCDEKYHWWKSSCRLSIEEITKEAISL